MTVLRRGTRTPDISLEVGPSWWGEQPTDASHERGHDHVIPLDSVPDTSGEDTETTRRSPQLSIGRGERDRSLTGEKTGTGSALSGARVPLPRPPAAGHQNANPTVRIAMSSATEQDA